MFDSIEEPTYIAESDTWTVTLYQPNPDHDESDPDSLPWLEGDRDGNWEVCETCPSWSEIDASLVIYYLSVLATGQDPLKYIYVKTTHKYERRWQVRFTGWIGQRKYGVRFAGARRNGRGEWQYMNSVHNPFPPELIDFLDVKMSPPGQGCLPDYISCDDLRERAVNVKWLKYKQRSIIAIGYVTVTETVQRSKRSIVLERKRVARECLTDLGYYKKET